MVGPSGGRGVAASWPVGPDGVTGSTGAFRQGNISGRVPTETVSGVGCADVAGPAGAADGAETSMVTGVAAGCGTCRRRHQRRAESVYAVVCAAAALAYGGIYDVAILQGVRDDGYGRLCLGDVGSTSAIIITRPRRLPADCPR